jgi:hypothetical protein
LIGGQASDELHHADEQGDNEHSHQ